MTFVTILHGFTPKLGLLVMNVNQFHPFTSPRSSLTSVVQGLSVFKIAILLFVVVSGN